MIAYMTLPCTHCQRDYRLRVSTYMFRHRSGQTVFFCSRRCARAYTHPARQEQMHALFPHRTPLTGPREVPDDV